MRRALRSWAGYGLLGVGGVTMPLPGVPTVPLLLAGAWLLPQDNPLREKMFAFAKRCLPLLSRRSRAN